MGHPLVADGLLVRLTTNTDIDEVHAAAKRRALSD